MNIETTMRKDKPAETAVIHREKPDAETAARRALEIAQAADSQKDNETNNHD